MMDAIQRAVPVPQAEVIMHGASGRQILGQRAPLAAGAQNVHHAVDHLADSDAPFAAAGLARRDQRLDMRPFRIGQVARITQFARGCSAGGCRQSTWGTSRANSPPQRITVVRLAPPGIPGKWTEYVAVLVMLRIRDWVHSHRRSTSSKQHNVSAFVLNELAESRASPLTDAMTDRLKADGRGMYDAP